MGVVDVVDGAVRWYARSALGAEYGDGVAVLVKSYTYLLGDRAPEIVADGHRES